MTTTHTDIPVDRLPRVIGEYLAAHAARDVDTALRAFTPTAVVVDDGSTYRGTEEIRRFLSDAGAEFSYTTTLVGAMHGDDGTWTAVNHIEGDFPGGTAHLRYRFTLDGDLVAGLVIAA